MLREPNQVGESSTKVPKLASRLISVIPFVEELRLIKQHDGKNISPTKGLSIRATRNKK